MPAPLTESEVLAIRADFPLLATTVNGSPLVYLDSAATSQKPLAVLDAERDYYLHRNAAVHRGAHTLAALATEEFEEARATVARFVGVDADEIVWTSNATEGINLVAYGQRLQPGDADFDADVDLSDFLLLRGDFGLVGRSAADFNLDGVVNLSDFLTLRSNFGGSANEARQMDAWAATVPEPACLAWLLGGSILLRRRTR